MKSANILWGIIRPSHFYYPTGFAESMINCITYCYAAGVAKFDFTYKASNRNDSNRNFVLKQAKDYHDYILMIDSDMVFPPETIQILLEAAEHNPDAVITGISVIGKPPFKPAVFQWPDTPAKKPTHVDEWKENSAFHVEACGSFCMLIPVAVAQKLLNWCRENENGEPFDHIKDYYPNEGTVEDRELRHDLAFSLRCKKLGIPIVCDSRASIGHLRPYTATVEDWIRNREFQPPKPLE